MFFIDLMAFYCVSLDCNGKLVFFIKLDECEVVKGHKLERVSITLMNKALQHAKDNTIVEEFSI